MRRFLTAVVTAALTVAGASAQPTLEDFMNPPKEYRPRVWWHWMNGNVTKDGIRKDIEWMDRVGIAGFHNFDAAIRTPQIVDRRLVYMSGEWKEAFNYALDLADSLGMEVTIASSPGWSVTGGPWVSEEDAEKKVTWRELILEGGQHFEGELPELYSCSGPYQDELGYPQEPDTYRWPARDICVLAVKMPPQDTARILYHKVKAGFVTDYKVADHFPTPETGDVTALEDVIDLTDSYRDGILTWNVPDGRWKVLRFGYNLLGRRNGPASPEATGLEVDKLDEGAMRRYYEHYLSMFDEASKGRLGSVISHLMIDSYESGRATWTHDMERKFRERRGYDLRPWLPVLTGQIIGSAEISERFLFDWRQTLGELMAECHYDLVDDILKPYGMKRHTESHEERRAFVGDGMAVKRNADIPMSAFWCRFRAGWHDTYPGCEADLKESSSVAHIYGQNICAAESFTTNGMPGKWDGWWAMQCYPGVMKPVADAALWCGLNRFIIHSTVHQPVDDKVPGLSLGQYGQWFNRHDTWAEEARPWTDYLARSSYMLSQGHYVADIAYFYGEDKNVTGRFYDERVVVPDGYSYDFVNADVLLDVVKPRHKALMTESGMHYKVLAIDREVRYMSYPVLRRIALFARRGVVICGPKPERCANLMASERKFERLAEKTWSRRNVTDGSLEEAMALAGVDKDVRLIAGGEEAPSDSVKFVHRALSSGDIYWIDNNSCSKRRLEVSLRASGRRPELWNAENGAVSQASYRIADGRTSVMLDMNPDDAIFIVMTEKTSETSSTVKEAVETEATEIEGPWMVAFQSGRGAPESAIFPKLASWTDSPVSGIRYFSGTATYVKDFVCDRPSGPSRIILDLGAVGNMARVCLNGRDLGLLWRAPYMVDVTDALSSENHLEVRVVNSWANRLIGDEQPDVPERITFTSYRYYSADDPLPASGLMGPVKLITQVSR